jgi:hypothetical protein
VGQLFDGGGKLLQGLTKDLGPFSVDCGILQPDAGPQIEQVLQQSPCTSLL